MWCLHRVTFLLDCSVNTQNVLCLMRKHLQLSALVGMCLAESTLVAAQRTAAQVTYTDVSSRVPVALANDQTCFVDVNNDHYVDLISGGVIWLNIRGTSFKNIGSARNVVAADYDNDGLPDLFSWSERRLLRNIDGNKFVGIPLPALPEGVSRGACWSDFNSDGFVDLVVGGYEDWDRGITYPSTFLRNDAGKGFTQVFTDSTFRTRGISAADYDRSGRPSVYMSNYRLQPNNLYVIGAEGTDIKANGLRAPFVDFATLRNALGTAVGFDGGHSIGSAWGDIDNDGWLDLFVGNFAHVDSRGDQPKSRVLRSSGPSGRFVFDDLGSAGLAYQESYASPALADADNDGRLDLFFTTVYGTASFGLRNFPVLMRNHGACWFSDMTEVAGLAGLPPTYQAAWADVNNDGVLDLSSGGKLFLGKVSRPRNWIGISLEGDGRRVNRLAIGAQVVLRANGQLQTRQVEAGTGEGNQSDLRLHFGLGARCASVDMDVFWPDGTKQHLRHMATDRFHVVKMGGRRSAYR